MNNRDRDELAPMFAPPCSVGAILAAAAVAAIAALLLYLTS